MQRTDAPIANLLAHLESELRGIRSGRANPSLIEQVPIAAYGSPMKLVELASITVPEPRQLLVQPWDTNLLKDIERGIAVAKLDLHPVVDGKLIRITLPSLTEERRTAYRKLAREKTEQAKVALRRLRDDAMRDLRDAERAGTQSEDEVKREKERVESIVKEVSQDIDERYAAKERELTAV
ncbi:MAG: ribosome recycling factor [Candidatus Kerfeldbacteria bacterium]|nr:ribosome recycling factor [Candidatus Kerfeldbacteria bacterium]